jgi:NAD(P)-dependent dehydrogenase (short-subunit alcohol dehydrogenase family)
MNNVNETTTIITGSSSGIGLDIARGFLRKGGNVVINGRDAEKLSRIAGELGAEARVATVPGDIGNGETGEALVRAAVERFGRVDVLVNNAGTFEPKPFVDVTPEELDGYLNGNLRGTYLTTQAVVKQMKRQGDGGAIVNIGTVLIDHAIGGFPASAPLVSKGGIHALTNSLAAELAADKIRVNMVAPGVVRTPLQGVEVDAFGGIALLGRVGEVEEITEAVLYLTEAALVTGHILPVDGGFITGRA